jgi:hypothetical protein
MRIKYLLFALLLFPIARIAGENTTQIKAYSLSVELASHVNPFGSVVYLTTYDGLSSHPLLTSEGNISEELSPSSANPSHYQADYMIFTGSTMIEYGSMTFRMPSTDSNNNGVFDWLEVSNATNISVGGSIDVQWPSSSIAIVPFNASFQRAAGVSTGSVSYTYDIDTGDGTVSVSAVTSWQVTNLVGELVYNPSRNLQLEASAASYGGSYSLSGSSTYTSQSEGTLQIKQAQLTNQLGNYVLAPLDLARSGYSYKGLATLDDGVTGTNWPDFTDWYVILTDTNDADGDGIPDLTDATSSGTATFTPGGWNYLSWPWAYSDSDQAWLYFSAVGNAVVLWRQKDGKWYMPQTGNPAWVAIH